MNTLNFIKAKIVENGYGIGSFAKEIGTSRQSLGAKLSGKRCFSVNEIERICKTLAIPKEEIGHYFFDN